MGKFIDESGNPTTRGVVAGVAGVITAIFLVLFLILFLQGWGSVPVDKVGLHYTGGPIDGQKFAGIIDPGSGTKFLGLRDKLVKLPITQRDYVASEEEGADGPPILAPAKGGVEMQFEVATYFSLNTSDEVVRRFYERICVKFDCTSSDGWNEMLRVNFRKPIEQAIQQAARQHTVNELYAGEAVVAGGEAEATALLVTIQEDLARELKENINDALGGDYFCGPSFDRSKPDECPDFQFQITKVQPTKDAVIDAFSENAASAQGVITAENNAQAAVAEAQGQKEAADTLAGIFAVPGYVEYLNALALQACAANGNCTIVATPGGTGVNVNTGSTG